MFGLMRVSNHQDIVDKLVRDMTLRHEEIIDALADGLYAAGDDFTKHRIEEALMRNGHMSKFHSLWRAQRPRNNA
jgi:hypothetical protein